MASAPWKADVTTKREDSSTREHQTALPTPEERVEELISSEDALATKPTSDITKASTTKNIKTNLAAFGDHPNSTSTMEVDNASRDATQIKPEQNTNHNLQPPVKQENEMKIPTGPKIALNKVIVQLPSHSPSYKKTLPPLSEAVIDINGTGQPRSTKSASKPIAPALEQANSREDMMKLTSRVTHRADMESSGNYPTRPKSQSEPHRKRENGRREQEKASRDGAARPTPTAVMPPPKWPTSARRPSDTNAFRPAFRDPYLDLERLASQDRDLRDWLQFTGWNDEGYRRRTLDRQRRLDEIDRERAALMDADADERENMTRRDGGPDPAVRELRASELRRYEPDLSTRHAGRDLFSPDWRGDYPGFPTSGFKREYGGDHDVGSPRKVARTYSKGSRHGPARGPTFGQREPHWGSELYDEDWNPNYQPGEQCLSSLSLFCIYYLTELTLLLVRGLRTGAITPPRFQGPRSSPPRRWLSSWNTIEIPPRT